MEKLLTQSRFSIRGYLKKKQTQAALGTHFSGIPDQYECKPRNRKREGKNLPGSHFNHQTVWSRPAHDVVANFRFLLTSCGIFFNYVCDAIAIDHFVLCPSLEPTILMKCSSARCPPETGRCVEFAHSHLDTPLDIIFYVSQCTDWIIPSITILN